MRDLYNRLIEEGEAGILRLIAERTQEGLQLDFKQKSDARRGSFDENDKKILAKSLSGFANSAGGLLIWGVNAEKDANGVDCATLPPMPIINIELFQSEAVRFSGQLIQPRHDGIHIEAIKCNSNPDAGYLLIYVERSQRRPHRSEAKNQKQYFKRAGESFFEMEHYDIEDAFDRQHSIDLEFYWHIKNSARPSFGLDSLEATIICGLKNVSRNIAKFPYLTLKLSPGIEIAHETIGRYTHGLSHSVRVNEHVFSGGADDVIHPEMELPVATIRVAARKYMGKWQIGGEDLKKCVLKIDVRYGCEFGRMQQSFVGLSPRALAFKD